MKSRATEYEALLTPIERMVRMARYWGERASKKQEHELSAEILDYAEKMAQARFANYPKDAPVPCDTKPTRDGWIHAIRYSIEWFRSGLPKVTAGHRHAAALMCTNMPSDAAPELRMPWSTFFIDVPDGLGLLSFGQFPIRQIGLSVCNLGDASHSAYLDARGSIKVIFLIEDISSDGIDVPGHAYEAVADLRDLSNRASEYDSSGSGWTAHAMIYRLALGIVAELNQPRESAAIAHGASKPRLNRRGEPIVSTFALSRDIKVDCREAVREYIRGARGTSPTVQSLVRGHWKKQPCGAARSDRRLIFVEPYWRGPETAPIALRAHSIGHREEVSR